MSVRLPLADPQFWIVTGGAVLALLYAIRKLRRRTRSENETACERCPKPGNPLGPGGGASGPSRVGALVAAALAGVTPLAAASVERQVAAMGTTLRVEVEVTEDRAGALAVAEAMIREIEATEKRLSTWIASSELARINRTPVGQWIESTAIAELAAAAQCAQTTRLAFHPAIGRLVSAWNLRGAGRVPTPAELAVARRGLDGIGFESSADATAIRRTADVVLEEGGFGKGAGLDAAFARLAKLPWQGKLELLRLDLGGQLAWASATRPVVVELADPRARARSVMELTLPLRRASLASSGNSERRLTVDGRSFGHLLDPRSGSPAPSFGSVAVVSEEGSRADCLSTALYVMGPEEGARWLAGRSDAPGVVFLVVEGDRLRALMTADLAPRARPLVADLEIEILNGSS